MPSITSDPLAELAVLYQQGRFPEVEKRARALIHAHPDLLQASNALGLSLLGQNRAQEAAEIYSALVRSAPHEALLWNNYGTALRAAGRLDEAEKAYEHALHLEPRNPDILASMGFLRREQNRLLMAKELLLSSLRINPGDVEVRIHAARICMDCGEWEQAQRLLQNWQNWISSAPASLQIELARLLVGFGKGDEAEPLLRSLQNDPEFGIFARACLILLLERVNRLDEAMELLSMLPEPDEVADHQLRRDILEVNALLAARNNDNERARHLYELLLESAQEKARTSTLFLLGNLCDKLGDYAACMRYLQLAHTEQVETARQLVPDLMDPATNPFNITNYYVSEEQFRAWAPSPAPGWEESPIFILGFPRSGTTMLEQMLDAHPDLVSMDEQPFVQRVIEKIQAMGLHYPEQLGALDSAKCEELRQTYWSEVRSVVYLKTGQRLVDKNPLTTLRLPLLMRLFPQAKIIFAVRHPCDVVLSNYKQQFSAPAYIAMCATLSRLATGYSIAMKFWNVHADLFKPQILEWKYEDVIAHFDKNIERLGDFLKLKNVAPLRNFSEHAKRKGYIATPSYAQVVRPIYADSIGRWRKYREYFEPILPMLEPAMKHWGYEV